MIRIVLAAAAGGGTLLYTEIEMMKRKDQTYSRKQNLK
uniref:Uncharacterized protein n=1 Tax=Brassica oleracea TaxID=3712 RepID=A0A3P6G2V9_BRAOL|nr:unnamed protein product [Brassica oleracea]